MNDHLSPDRHHVPRGRLPAEGVTFGKVPCTHTSEGVTPLSSLLRPHGPLLRPLCSWCGDTCQSRLGWWSPPRWPEDVPVVISAKLSWDARTPLPAPAWVPVVVSSPRTSAFPATGSVGVAHHPCSHVPRGKCSALPYPFTPSDLHHCSRPRWL